MAVINFEDEPSKKTPISAGTLNALQYLMLDIIFPIGSTYVTQTNTNPVTILGVGVWERLKGKVCIGLDENDEDLNAIGKTGGEKEHTLTVEELAKHRHNVLGNFQGTSGNEHTPQLVNKAYDWSDSGVNDNASLTGGNQPHNNMPPYEVVGYMWIRRG